MKKYALSLILALCACNPNKTVLNAELHPIDRGWGSHAPVWADEFNGTTLDTTKWVAAEFCGGYNNEGQCYRPQNISFNGAHMTITAQVETCDGDGPSTAPNEDGAVNCPPIASSPDFSYTSARIHTRAIPLNPLNAWRYGRIEIRAKLPYGQGTWPAFWMMPEPQNYGSWPRSGEIDILEAVNLHSPNMPPDYIQSNIHLCSEENYHPDNTNPNATWECQQPPAPFGPTYHKVDYAQTLGLTPDREWVPNLSADFHTYAMEWSDWDMRFFLDDILIGRIIHGADTNSVAPFREPFYLIVNLAVGGNWPGVPNPNAATNPWAQSPARAELVLDWVRIYTCVPDPTARNCIYQGDSGIGRQ